ncbi:phenylalanine--tRNA ligase subunit beta [Candidatus Peregrinibacteria bacterium]|jgi:phenylalanyl-tRNA synthetase beta chain|nr:phenylalanine--tRNA ligase subunit beta [Candidatus Peregrinibacteria bacterium]
MHISLNWLKDYVDIPKDLDPNNLAKTLTLKTAEVEGVSQGNELLDGVVVGHVTELKPHPNANKLKLAKISCGEGKSAKLVCGGDNLEEGMYVAYAAPGCKVKWHGEGAPVTLEKAKIRGEESEGMICASDEIGIEKPESEGEQGILDLSALKPKPGIPLTELFGNNDAVLEIDNKSLTHRPDLWGHYGIAREVAAITESSLKPYKANQKFPEKGEKLTVDVKDKTLCPRFAACLISNVKIGPSPDWMVQKLNAVGVRSVNNIVDVTNYVMLDIGQPMHAYDRDLVKTDTLKVELAKKGQKVETIDHKKRTLAETDILVTDGKGNFLDLAGIMGGLESEINDNTTNIILEAANWNASMLRQSSVRHGLRSDASQRFEKGQDPENCPIAIAKATELILEMCPEAKIASPLIDIHNAKTKAPKLTLNIPRTNAKIGIEISKSEMAKILESLGFKVTDKSKDVLEVEVPSWRSQKDVTIEEDLIEEIARIYGYEEIPATLPELPARLPKENIERTTKHEIRKYLAYGLGLNEIYTYSFYSKEDFENAGLSEEGHVLLENYLSEDQTHMRTSLVPNILRKIALNIKYESHFELFEIGRTYKDLEYFPLEEKWITGTIVAKPGKIPQSKQPFYQAKTALEKILQHFKIPYYRLAKGSELPYAHPIKSTTILTPKGETLGSVFVLHPQIAKNFGLENQQIAMFELNLSSLTKLEKAGTKFSELPKFPPIQIDVSVVVDQTKEVAELKNAILKADKHLIKEVDLFDLYEGDNLDKGKKSVAFAIKLQAEDRTLTDEEMAETQSRIFKNLEKLGGKIRGL